MKDNLIKLLSISLTLYMSFIIIFRQNYNNITWYMDFIMITIFILLCLLKKKTIYKYNSIILLYAIFISLSIASSFWAVDFEGPMFRINPMILLLLNLFVIYNIIKEYNLLDYAFYGILLGSFVNYLILLNVIHVPFDVYMGSGYDNRAIGTLGNPNNLSTTMLISMVVSFIYIFQSNKINKIFYFYQYVNIFFAIYLVLLSVSKQGIILTILLIFGYLIVMISNKKNWGQLIILFLLSSLIFIFFIDKTQLYHTFDLITERFSAFNNVVLEGSSGGSTGARKALIEFGLQAFQDKPLFGYGFNNFAAISPTGSWAENNYIELLVGVGLIGTLFFYSIYISLLLKIYFMKQSSIQYLLYFFILLIFVMDMSSIVYGLKIKLFTILLISILAEQYRRDDRKI